MNNYKEIYIKETGILSPSTDDYIEWLEHKLDNPEPSIIRWIKEMFEHAEKKEWFETYWSIDIHGTISRPDYRKSSKTLDYYPYAKETLQLLSDREDIILTLFTSSYPDEIEIYMNEFKKDNIIFNYVGENPEVSELKGSFGYYEKKHYFNVLMDDKCGFKPGDWKHIYDYLVNSKYKPVKKC